jgi:AraC-like DNA-binding protein
MKFFYENKDQTVFLRQGDSLEFGAHLHTHFELVYMLDGKTRALVDSKDYVVEAGDVLLVFPNQIHQYFRIGLENFLIIIFPLSLCSEFQSFLKAKLPVSPVIRNAATKPEILQTLLQIKQQSDVKTSFSEGIIKGHFLVLLGELFQLMTFEDAKAAGSDTLQSVISFCLENYQKDISLDRVAEALHISKYYLSHVFADKLHMRFNDYIAMLRMTEACNLLIDGKLSITEIAYEVGFNTPRSFNRAFLKHVGMTPRDYQKSCLNPQTEPLQEY